MAIKWRAWQDGAAPLRQVSVTRSRERDTRLRCCSLYLPPLSAAFHISAAHAPSIFFSMHYFPVNDNRAALTGWEGEWLTARPSEWKRAPWQSDWLLPDLLGESSSALPERQPAITQSDTWCFRWCAVRDRPISDGERRWRDSVTSRE